MAREIYKTVPLDDQLVPEVLRGSNFTNETFAHQFIITCTKANEPVRLTGSVRGRFIAADNTSFLIEGSIVNGNAVVTLHQDCYHAPGRFQFVIFNTNGTENVAIYAAVGEVRRSDTNELYITGEPLPDIDELLDAMGDLRDIIQDYDDIVLVQSEQPTSATNKIWIQPQADEYQVPTLQEHEELAGGVDDLKSAVDPLSKGINTEGKIYPYAVVDKNGKAALVLDEDGYAMLKQKYLSTEANKLSINDGTGNTIVTQDTTGLFDYAVCDQDGKILFYVDSGVLHVKEIESDNVSLALDSMNKRLSKELNADRNKACNLDAEINMFIAYGQSWACGYDANAISTTQKYDNIMFDIGIKNNPLTDMDQTATSFIPMVEESTTSNGAGSQTTGETPVSAMCGMIKQLLQAENGYAYTDVKYQMLGNCPGMGSKTLAQLEKGTIYYNRLISQVQMAFDIASALGKKLVVQAFSWQQGELGKAGNYAECLEQLRADIDTDVKAITGQTQPVKCITWQTMLYTSGAAEDFYQRYVGASETYPNIICSGAAYQFKHVADNNLHLKSVDQDWAGAYLGLAYKRTIIDGTKFVPLKPIKAEIVGKSVYLKFDVPVKPIVFDTDTVTAADNKGFGLTNSGGTAKTISGVEIIAPDIIKITSSATIDETDKISYGQNAGDSFGPTSGNRGNVRDSQGETIICTAGNGETIPLHNWLVCFNKTINDLMA